MSDKRVFKEQADAGVDANDTATVSTPIEMQAYRSVSYQVQMATGVVGSLVTTIQGSNDGTNYEDTSTTITGEDIGGITDFPYKYARLKVSTASGAAATADISGIAKA